MFAMEPPDSSRRILSYASALPLPPRRGMPVLLAVIANIVLVAGSFLPDMFVFTELFTIVAVYCLLLNVLIFLSSWRRFRFGYYIVAIHGVTYGLAVAFMILIAIFGRRYFEFVL